LAIESVLVQKPAPLEVIVVDDGSTDDTETVVAGYGDRIAYRRIRNGGRPAIPRNVGIELARGELVAFQDSDDEWAPGKLERQLPLMDDRAVVLSYGNAGFMGPDGDHSGDTVIDATQARRGSVFPELVQVNFISTLTVVARRDALLAAGGFNEAPELRGVEDYELWLRLSRTGTIEFVPETLGYYRRHDDNIGAPSYRDALLQLRSVYLSVRRQKLSGKERPVVMARLAEMERHLTPYCGPAERLLRRIRAKIYESLSR
jgi:glycosyltransferase involved in cell wall biosynthesis